MKYFEKRKLVRYRKNLDKITYPEDYLEYHKVEIECLDWLISSYEGKAGEPIVYLEALINIHNIHKHNYDDYVFEMKKFNIEPMKEEDMFRNRIRRISFLYNWVYYKKITGF